MRHVVCKYTCQGYIHICWWCCSHSTKKKKKKDHSYFQETKGFPRDQGQSAWASSTFHLFQNSSSISPVCAQCYREPWPEDVGGWGATESTDVHYGPLPCPMDQLHTFPKCRGQNMEIKWQMALFFCVTSLSHNKAKQTDPGGARWGTGNFCIGNPENLIQNLNLALKLGKINAYSTAWKKNVSCFKYIAAIAVSIWLCHLSLVTETQSSSM